MFIQKNLSFRGVMTFTGGHLIWLTAWMVAVACLYHFTSFGQLVTISWLPISVIGTAVAFYLGFKNNSAYDRLWEARKIWGGIVNSSRAWGSAIRAYITNQFSDSPYSEQALKIIHKKMIYRHIGWLYALRSQLLLPTPWEHINQNLHIARTTRRRMKQFGVGLLDDDISEKELSQFLPKDEYDELIKFSNTATQIIDRQSQALMELRRLNLIEDFRHMELQKILHDFYDHQGKCERIKKFPLPRQYGSMSFVFVGIFIFLLPFGMVTEFRQLGEYGIWVSIPFSVLVAWVYLVMELVGDYSENPFEGLGNDIPMLSLCRTIEIDLREMLGETELPPPIEAKNGVLL